MLNSLSCCVESKYSLLSLRWAPERSQCLLSVPVVARGIDFLACLCFSSDGKKLHHMPADTLKQTQDKKHYVDMPVSFNRTGSSPSVDHARFFFLNLFVHVQEFRSDNGVWLLLSAFHCRRGSCTAKTHFLFPVVRIWAVWQRFVGTHSIPAPSWCFSSPNKPKEQQCAPRPSVKSWQTVRVFK